MTYAYVDFLSGQPAWLIDRDHYEEKILGVARVAYQDDDHALLMVDDGAYRTPLLVRRRDGGVLNDGWTSWTATQDLSAYRAGVERVERLHIEALHQIDEMTREASSGMDVQTQQAWMSAHAQYLGTLATGYRKTLNRLSDAFPNA